MSFRILKLGIVCGLVAATIACASVGRSAADEMKLGYKAARRGYWQEALMRFQQADALQRDNPRILNNMAVAQEAVGRYDDALATYERARQIDPNDRNLRRNQKALQEFYSSYVERPDEDQGDEEGSEEADEEASDG